MPNPLYAHPGERIRVLVKGRQTHSIIGTVESTTYSNLEISRELDGHIFDIPTISILTIEIEVVSNGQAKWEVGTIPPRLSQVFEPLGQMFLTGGGGVPRDLSDKQLSRAILICDSAEKALTSIEYRELLDRARQAITTFSRLRRCDDFETLSRLRDSTLALCTELERDCEADFSLSPLKEAAGQMKQLVGNKWRDELVRFDPKPRFFSSNSPTQVSISATGEVDLPLRIQSDSQLAPALDVVVLFDDSTELGHLTRAPEIEELHPGDTRVVRSRVVLDHTLSFLESKLTVRAQLRYRTPSGSYHTSPKQTIQFVLVPESQFETVPNPYIAYAGGSAVADPQMFFGRTELVTTLVDHLRDGPLGSGMALYGQKRSGKTSLVEQIRRLANNPPVIVVSVSFGLLERRQLTVSFVRAVLNQVRVSLYGHLTSQEYDPLDRLWPSDEKIDARPMESLQSALIAGRMVLSKKVGWAGLRYIFLFDEFTYLFEVLRSEDYTAEAREDVREFMRQWKALLESRVFSCVVVGQDTMPMFMQRFANEFSSMAPKRLAYLDLEETKSLSDKPILKSTGESRYTGYALESIYEWTQGHPFFTQVLCDRIVQLANERKRSEITESDVDDALESLMEGARKLDPFRFDCLLTADNTGLLNLRDQEDVIEEIHDPDSDYLYQVLSRLATLSGASNSYVDIDEVLVEDDDWYLIQDFLIREVVEQKDGVRIKLPLFAEYLRRTI